MAFILDDQNNQSGNGSVNIANASTDQLIGQQFVPSVSAAITRLTFKLQRNNSPTGNIFARVYTNNAGEPGTLLGQSASIAASSISAAAGGTLYDFDFTGGPFLSQGVTYWCVVGNDTITGAINYVLAFIHTPNYRADAKRGTPWAVINPTYSLVFREYRDLAPGGAALLPL